MRTIGRGGQAEFLAVVEASKVIYRGYKIIKQLRSCVNREWAWVHILYLFLPTTLINRAVPVDVKHQERRKRRRKI